MPFTYECTPGDTQCLTVTERMEAAIDAGQWVVYGVAFVVGVIVTLYLLHTIARVAFYD